MPVSTNCCSKFAAASPFYLSCSIIYIFCWSASYWDNLAASCCCFNRVASFSCFICCFVLLLLISVCKRLADTPLLAFLQKKSYYSKSIKNYVNKWGEKDRIVVKQLGAKYRLFQVFLENGKFKMLVKHPFLSVYTYFRLFLVGLVFLAVKKLSTESDV